MKLELIAVRMTKVENGWVVTGTFTDGKRQDEWTWGYNEESSSNAFGNFTQDWLNMAQAFNEAQKQK